MRYELIPVETEKIASAIVDCAFKVHKTLGPGLLESVYETCLSHELSKIGIENERQVSIPVRYDGITFDEGFRLDLLVSKSVVIELKTTEKLLPIHEAQLLTYLKLTKIRLGFLMNFNSEKLKSGIKRLIL